MADQVRCARCRLSLPARSIVRDFGGMCPRCLIIAALDPDREELPPRRSPFRPGERFRGLEILERVGEGGSGIVHKARHLALNRIVAIKVLNPALSTTPEFVRRFEREARALAALEHPGIVRVLDSGQEEGLCFLVMEHVAGLSLRDVIRTGPVAPAEARRIILQACDALDAAHAAGVIHRDIKPENLLLDEAGRVKVVDFGLATTATGAPVTREGRAMGTPHYVAPEQLEDLQSVDVRADVYSLGVVFYELLTGKLPLGRFDPPPAHARTVLAMLDRERGRRPASMKDVQAALWEDRPRRLMKIIAAAASMISILLLAWWMLREPDGLPGTWEGLGESDGPGGVSRNEGGSGYGTMAADRSGAVFLAWDDNSGGKFQVYLRRWDGRAWDELDASATGGGLSRSQTDARGATLVLDSKGRPVLAWREQLVGGGMEVYLRRWNGSAWEELAGSASGAGVSAAAGRAWFYDLAMGPDDRPVVAWGASAAGGKGVIFLRRWSGSAWEDVGGSTAAGGVSRTAGTSIGPNVDVDAEGRIVVAWCTAVGAQSEIYLRRWDGQAWTELGGSASGGGISASTAPSDAATLDLDARGNPVVAWQEAYQGVLEIYLKRWTGSRWETLDGSASGRGVSGSEASSYWPRVKVDREGRPVLLWLERIADSLGYIYVRRWSGSRWQDLGGSARDGGLAQCSAAQLAIDSDDRPVVCWQEVTGRPTDILLRRFRPTR